MTTTRHARPLATRWSWCALPLMLAACATPGDLPPRHALWAPVAVGSVATNAIHAAATPWPTVQWWSAFGDAQLSHLIEQALTGQPSLQLVQARLRQAQAAVDLSAATSGPQLNASVDLSDQHFTKNGLIPPPLAGSLAWNNSAQLGGSWELDLFGRQRAALESAIGQQRAVQADAQAARVLLAGQVAAAYFQLARAIETRDLAAQSLAQRQQMQALVRQRIAAGLDTQLDQRLADGLIAQALVEIEALDEATARARHALAEVTGQPPQALQGLAPRLAKVQVQPLPGTLPLDLLGRRADLVAQRWRVEAASLDVDVARAQFHPNINLVGFVGLSSLGLSRFIDTGSVQYGAGPALRLPIFDGGRLRANLQGRHAEVDAAIEAYNGALLRALREVADELASLQSLARQQMAQADAQVAAEDAQALAMQRHAAGLGNFLSVLSAQTNVLAQQRAATELKARALVSSVALSRALGGGYLADADALPLARAASASPAAGTAASSAGAAAMR